MQLDSAIKLFQGIALGDCSQCDDISVAERRDCVEQLIIRRPKFTERLAKALEMTALVKTDTNETVSVRLNSKEQQRDFDFALFVADRAKETSTLYVMANHTKLEALRVALSSDAVVNKMKPFYATPKSTVVRTEAWSDVRRPNVSADAFNCVTLPFVVRFSLITEQAYVDLFNPNGETLTVIYERENFLRKYTQRQSFTWDDRVYDNICLWEFFLACCAHTNSYHVVVAGMFSNNVDTRELSLREKIEMTGECLWNGETAYVGIAPLTDVSTDYYSFCVHSINGIRVHKTASPDVNGHLLTPTNDITELFLLDADSTAAPDDKTFFSFDFTSNTFFLNKRCTFTNYARNALGSDYAALLPEYHDESLLPLSAVSFVKIDEDNDDDEDDDDPQHHCNKEKTPDDGVENWRYYCTTLSCKKLPTIKNISI